MKRRSFLSLLGVAPAVAVVLPAVASAIPATFKEPVSLLPMSQSDALDILQQASTKGVPIPLKMWYNAAHIDPDVLLRDLWEDNKRRSALKASPFIL